MILLALLLAMGVGALSALARPWIPPGTFGSWTEPVNVLLGALVGLVIAALVGWGVQRYLHTGVDGLKRWWQASLLALAGALLAAAVTSALALLFGPYPVLLSGGGVLTLMMMWLGLALGVSGPLRWRTLWAPSSTATPDAKPKLLDTSVIIDGRISDLVRTGFIEGKLVLTHYVLQELHAIADSSEPLRRRKGRRGLDILSDLQNAAEIELETVEHTVPQHRDVDHKLIELAKLLKADLVTTDYNLNKVAKVEGVRVLNINELANAVKPRYLPGEPLDVEVLDKGEESGQGIGYLDDGTMVVVENGRNHIGKTVAVVVSSTLQTDAGKMLFVRLRNNNRRGQP